MRPPAAIIVASLLSVCLAAFMGYATALQVPVAVRLSKESWVRQPGAPVAVLLCVAAALLSLLFALGAYRLWRRGDPSLILIPHVLVGAFVIQGMFRVGTAETREVLAYLAPFALIALFTGLCLTPAARQWISTRAGTRPHVRRVR